MKVTIVGLGLIGGSLGLALRAAQGNIIVTGWDRDPATVEQAHARGVVDETTSELAQAVYDADIVVVATPVLAVRAVFEQIAPHLSPGTLVTDVASTKARVVQWAQHLLPAHVVFVGGHPMAGSEQRGIANARADLLRGAVYCVTPLPDTPAEALARLEALITRVGARPLRLAANEHDADVAAVSHLPFLLSAGLVQLTTSDERWPEMRQLAATGYRDLTRLASGDPQMHRDICLTNVEAIRSRLLSMARLLEEVAGYVDDPAYLQTLFEEAQQRRDEWLRQHTASEHDLR